MKYFGAVIVIFALSASGPAAPPTMTFEELFPPAKQKAMGLQKLTKKEKETLSNMSRLFSSPLRRSRCQQGARPRPAQGRAQPLTVRFTDEENAWLNRQHKGDGVAAEYIRGKWACLISAESNLH